MWFWLWLWLWLSLWLWLWFWFWLSLWLWLWLWFMLGWSGLVLEVGVFIGRPESIPCALARSSWRAPADSLCFVAAVSAVSPSVINQQPTQNNTTTQQPNNTTTPQHN